MCVAVLQGMVGREKCKVLTKSGLGWAGTGVV